MQCSEERVFGGQSEDAFLGHRTLDVVVLYDDVFLQDLDRVHLVRAFVFRQHHLMYVYHVYNL